MKLRHTHLALPLVLALAAAAACSSPPRSSPASEDAGATCPPTPTLTCTDPQSSPSYANDVVPILQERCAQCHFPGGVVAATINLSTYTDVVNQETAMIQELYSCLMPPIAGNTMYGIAPGSVAGLSADQLDTLVQWIECGAKDN